MGLGEQNPISALRFPSRDEMPALPQLDHCPAEGKSTVLVCVPFLFHQTHSGRSSHVSITGHCSLDIWWLTQQISEYSHDTVVFQDLLGTETQGHLRGDQKGR